MCRMSNSMPIFLSDVHISVHFAVGKGGDNLKQACPKCGPGPSFKQPRLVSLNIHTHVFAVEFISLLKCKL